MAERPEDLNLPNAVITRIIKEAVSVEREALLKLKNQYNSVKVSSSKIEKYHYKTCFKYQKYSFCSKKSTLNDFM